jgi:uncharacterized protein (DUF2461 family)
MDGKFKIECLGCGEARGVPAAPAGTKLDPGECPRCGYLGWAPSTALTERVRRGIRERPLEWRARIFAV